MCHVGGSLHSHINTTAAVAADDDDEKSDVIATHPEHFLFFIMGSTSAKSTYVFNCHC